MDWFVEILRKLAVIIDYGIYSLADIIYKVFCTIANTELISSEEITKFTNRVYVILGVFMLFKVGFSMLKYLVNPDSFSNQNTGYNKLIWNISTALVLLVMMPTIYNYAMRLQNAVISNDVMGKLILGTSGGGNSMETGGAKISFTVLSAFMMPRLDDLGITENLYDTDANNNTILNSTMKTKLIGVVDDNEAIDQYERAIKNNDIKELTQGEHAPVMAHIKDDKHSDIGGTGNYTYLIQYRWGVSSIVGLFLCFIFLTFCIDIAIRSIKIAFLMLIAPIPILSMINPEKGSKGMLSKWFEMAWATYLDLFLRLASINFVVYIISRIQTSVWGALLTAAGKVAVNGAAAIAVFAMVFIIIGALLFAKQLPDMVIKLFPMMEGIVKGGFNPLKKLGEAANVASRAPIVGKGITGLSNRFATQHAMNRANKNMEAAKRKEKEKDFQNKMNQIKNSKAMNADERKKALDDLKNKHKDEMDAFDKESAERLKSQKERAKEEGKYAGATAAAGIGIFGGESKPMTSAGEAAAKIKKESADKIHKMQMGALQQRQADANLAKVEDQATYERGEAIKQNEKQIVDVQREAEIEKRMKDPKYNDMTKEEAKSAAAREVQAMENQKLKEQAVEKRTQEKMAQGKSETEARASAQQEVANMSSADIAKEGNPSKVYSDAAAESAKQQAIKEGKSEAEAQKIGVAAAKASRSKAEEQVVGSLSDKMDEVAERQGVIYNSAEYAEQVKITREAKNRRNAAQSEYEKSVKEQQLEGKVTTANGVVLEGQDAINYVDDLRVAYTKASGDYDFMSKELDSMAETYPDDAATRKGYEAAKDYKDKKNKVIKYASQTTKVSDNDKEGGQYTIEELIQEDTIVNGLRRADAEFAGTRTQIVTRQSELEAQGQILQAQINDNMAAGNTGEVTRLQNELNVNNVELGRVQTSLRAADIARSNVITGLANEKSTINTTLEQLETEYQQVVDQSTRMTENGVVTGSVTNEILARKQELEQKIKVLNDRNVSIDREFESYGVDPSSVDATSGPNVILDTRIDGVGKFDRVGTPIRTTIENMVNQMELDVQRMNDTTLSLEERKKAELAVDSAYAEYQKELEKFGEALYSGMNNDSEKQLYDKKMNDRIKAIIDKKNSDGE